MKKPTLATRAPDEQQPVPIRHLKKSPDSLDLSPERISEGASTTTEVLTQILEREERLYHFRHWGINE